MDKSKVVARMTITRADNTRVIVEVPTDASFHSFYYFYTQTGNRRSTKTLIRKANRNTGLPASHAHMYKPGLEHVAIGFQQSGYAVKIRIIRKRQYRTLIEAAPDALGMATATNYQDPRLTPKPAAGIPVYIPAGFKTIKEKWSILTGRG